MKDVIGIAWFKDEATYRAALEWFTDPESMPDSFEEWKTLVDRQCDLISGTGKTPLRADIEPESFVAWCASRGYPPNAEGRIAFVNYVVLEHEKARKAGLAE